LSRRELGSTYDGVRPPPLRFLGERQDLWRGYYAKTLIELVGKPLLSEWDLFFLSVMNKEL
jgi:hypothetical protein